MELPDLNLASQHTHYQVNLCTRLHLSGIRTECMQFEKRSVGLAGKRTAGMPRHRLLGSAWDFFLGEAAQACRVQFVRSPCRDNPLGEFCTNAVPTYIQNVNFCGLPVRFAVLHFSSVLTSILCLHTQGHVADNTQHAEGH
jgi:hypothetical protein